MDDVAHPEAEPFDPWHEGEGVRLERRGALARIVLDRPARLNALTVDVAGAIRDALQRCRASEIRAVLLTGAGRAFCAGADLSQEGIGEREDPARTTYAHLMEGYQPMFSAIRDLPKPVVAAVNGPAVGVGCSLALSCDLVVAAESAFFVLAFVNIGLTPDGGASVWIARRVGATRAAEMLMLGERLPAQRAGEWGLINRVHADERFAGEAEALGARLADGPTRAYAGLKRLTNSGSFADLDRQLEHEARLQSEMVTSADFREGVAAFRERRPPRFEGR